MPRDYEYPLILYSTKFEFDLKTWEFKIYNDKNIILKCQSNNEFIMGRQIVLDYLKLKIDNEMYLILERKIFETIC